MRPFANMMTGFALAAVSAMALEKDFVDQMMQSARNIERDASVVSVAVKTKRVDAEDVKKKIEAMSTDLSKLQELVNQYESTHPKLSDRDRADWQLIKDKVQLLEIFHGQKQRLANEDMAKNRSMIRAHADGVAKRALSLQATVAKLQRGPLS